MKVKKNILGLIVILVIVIIFVCVDDKRADYETENREVEIGEYDEEGALVSLNAEKIIGAGIAPSLITKPGAISEKTDYEQIADWIENHTKDGAEGFLLSDTENLSVSKCNLFAVDVKAAAVQNLAYEYLFSSGELVGVVQFHLYGNTPKHSISLYTSTNGVYLEFLEENRGKEYILLVVPRNGFVDSYFLDEDNRIYSAITGSFMEDIIIDGDCYGALATEELCISYEEIVNQIEPIR